jgi:hypothetical protein
MERLGDASKRYIGPPPEPVRKCPDCGGPVVALTRKFKPPPSGDIEQWAKVRYLVEHGYYFESVMNEQGEAEPYPATLNEAQAFVSRRDALAEKKGSSRARAPKKKSKSKTRPAQPRSKRVR